MTKYCPKCKTKKKVELFNVDRQRSDGRCGYCKACRVAYRASLGSNDYSRAWHLKKKYGLTPEQVEAMRVAQKRRCAACNNERSLVVDHDHATGKVRGLLCSRCNRALGFLSDDPKKILALHAYVLRSSAP